MNGKLVLSMLAGLVTSIILVFVLEMVGHILYPVDPAKLAKLIETNDVPGLQQFMNNMPIGAFFAVIFAHGFGLLGGLMVTRFIYKAHTLPLFGITIIIILSAVMNLFIIPHPSWFPIADIGFSLGLALLYIYSRKKA